MDVHGFVYPFYLLIYGFVCMNMIEYDEYDDIYIYGVMTLWIFYFVPILYSYG